LDKSQTILETLESMNSELTQNQLRTLLGSFLFKGDDVYKKISVLSGGEKSRVALSKILLTKSNFIILDEPTNHLDMASTQLLQTALVNFSGSLIIVSHDVDFLRPVANKIVDIRNNKIKFYEGDIDYYLWKKEEELKKNITENNKIKNTNIDTLTNKKELKRIEAEKRQKRFQATKALNLEIKKLEENINRLETREIELEKKLLDSSLYDELDKAQNINLEYGRTKKELEKLLLLWEEKQEELKEIESKFN